ncbi:hypothetical protein BOTBODRAFT_351298 [Botryobasidium botryosum FD-172 SS1]|uniref:F-box domain-containing protein n=1 Tax=Botryobasidium botryosum (strain FD-172 SS1) TaxID=930990 RepID=A0A067MEB2_BOTB1|nr:hypothetical protein BOTBODRAFT_351298 [Botryobasidium botryosum FD-172 SS1]
MQVIDTTRLSAPFINRLPTEIIAYIFELSQLVSSNSSETPDVALVSRLWRDIALGTATLWTKIDATNAHRTSVYLERSRDALLDIELVPPRAASIGDEVESKRYRAHAAKFHGFIEPLQLHANRWASLALKGNFLIYASAWREHLSLPAPSLERFSAEVGPPFAAIEQKDTPSDLFGGRAPRLRHLALTGVCVPLTSPIYTGLTYLRLGAVHFTHSSLHALFRNLSLCSDMEQLILSDVSFETDFDSSGPGTAQSPCETDPVPMARLQLLDVSQRLPLDIGVARSVLSSLRLAPTSRLRMSVIVDGADPFAVFPSAPHTTDNLPNIRGLRSLTVSLDDYSHRIEIHGERDATRMRTSAAKSDRESDFRADLLSSDFVPASLASMSRLALPLLESLVLSGISPRTLDTAAFTQVLAALPALKSLTFRSSHMGGVLAALLVMPSSLVCPRLESIEMQECDVDPVNLVEVVTSRTVLGRYSELLRGNGSCLRTLSVVRCSGVRAKTLEALRALPVDIQEGIPKKVTRGS